MKLKTILIILAVVLLGFIVASNFNSFKKLSGSVAKTKMPTRNFAYQNLFTDVSRFSNTFTFYGDRNRDSIGAYVVDKAYDLVLYKIRNLKFSDASIAEGLSFVKSQKVEASADVVYESSYKTKLYRFSVALNNPKLIRYLNIHYNGEIVGEPLFTPNSVKINLANLTGLAAFTDNENQVEFLINKRNSFSKAFSLEIILFRRNGSTYFAALCNRDNPGKQIERSVLEGLLKN